MTAPTQPIAIQPTAAATKPASTRPAGTVGIAYSGALPVPQLAAPYQWTVSAGALPPGITLSSATGALTGTPSGAGAFEFTVKVTDTNNQAATTAIVMTVAAAPYPSPSTTGPVSGTVFRAIGTGAGRISSEPGWSYSDGYVSITDAGTVFSGFSLSGSVVSVCADNVTIENCIIAAGGQSVFPVSIEADRNNNGNPITSLTIRNCTISGTDNNLNRAAACIKDARGAATGIRIQACNLYWAATGIQVRAGEVLDNYIHDLVCNVTYGDHVNGIAVSGGTEAMLVQHNTVLNGHGQTGCIALLQDNSPPAVSAKIINDNLLAGGAYCIYGGESGAEYSGIPATNIIVTNNLISTMYYANGGAFGPVAYFNSDNSGNRWSNNVWHDGPNEGAEIPVS